MNVPEWPQAMRPDWQTRRLRFALSVGPSDKNLDLADAAAVSFVPMDAVGEHGGLRLDQQKPRDEVRGGYTFFQDSDVLVAKITPCFENGKGAIAESLTNGVAYGTTELHVLRSGSELDPRFLFYLTLSHPFRKLGEAEMYGAGGQKRVPERFIKELRPALPGVAEQQTIARFLDYRTAQLDALIEKKRQLLDKLAEKRSALITRAVTQGLDPDAPMKDSGVPWLGEIPAHWEAMRLGKCLEGFEQGWSPACEDRIADDDEWAVLKAGCVNGGQFNESAHKALPVELEGRPRLQVLEGDVLMCRASGSPGLIGSVARVEAVRQKLMFSDKTYRITLNRRKMRADFFILVMLSKGLRDQIILSISGAEGLANNIAQADVKRYVVAAPPIEEQWRIQRYIARCSERLERHCASISQQVETLTEYRSALITAAVTGQIDVRDWQPPEASAA